jgi:hypothetical protein
MKTLKRTRVIMATSEKVTVWYSSVKGSDAADCEEVSVDCPHCREEAFRLELEKSEEREIKVYRGEP